MEKIRNEIWTLVEEWVEDNIGKESAGCIVWDSLNVTVNLRDLNLRTTEKDLLLQANSESAEDLKEFLSKKGFSYTPILVTHELFALGVHK